MRDPARHGDSFRAIQKFFRDEANLEIDLKCKDLARICFLSYDPDIWIRTEGNEIIEPLLPEPKPTPIPVENLDERQRIAVEILGQAIEFDTASHGLLTCPGKHLHTAKDGPRDCEINLDGAPTIYCFHQSCQPVLDGFNKLLRSRVGKTEFVPMAKPEQPMSGVNGEKEETNEEWFGKIQSSIVLATKADLGSLVLKPRVALLGEWLCEGDFGMIYGPRGVAKTWFSLLIANAIATSGTIGEWEAPMAKKVLFVDGEMPPDMIRDRLLGFGGSENITLLNHEILFERTEAVINLADTRQQDAILRLCVQQGFKVLILDNLSVCVSGVKENDSFEWERLQHWLIQFRRHQIAVILLHHAGISGRARGTTKREDPTAWVISLTDAKDRYEDKRGSRFISLFSKRSRNCMDIPAYEWHVVLDDGRVEVNWKLAHGADLMLQCIKDGVEECGMIASEMGVSPATVCRMAKKLEQAGKIQIRSRKYILTLEAECE
jgi:putative DNA primase/helicase